MRVNHITRPIAIKLVPTTPRILVLPMTDIDDAGHGVCTRLRVRPRRMLDVPCERHNIGGPFTYWHMVDFPTLADLMVDFLERVGFVLRRDEGEVGSVIRVDSGVAGSRFGLGCGAGFGSVRKGGKVVRW